MKTICLNTTSPAFNLAAEEVLFDGAAYGCPVCLIWQNSPSLIVGVNQNTLAEIDGEAAARTGVSVVRRLSGGGTVYHDLNNINYSFITDADPDRSLADFTRPVRDFLASLGLTVSLTGRNDLCAETEDGPKKLSGTASYTKNGKTLFHGTLLFSSDGEKMASLLKCDPEKFTRKGIASVKSRVGSISELLPEPMDVLTFRKKLTAYLAGEDPVRGLTMEELEKASRLRREKYADDAWTYGRFSGYGFSRKERYPFGGVTVSMDIRDGIIRAASVSGDFFSSRPVTELEEALTGVAHSPDGIGQALQKAPVSECILGMTEDEFKKLIL